MQKMLHQFWHDDQGALIATEYLFFVTIVVIGTVVGMTNLRDAVNVELTESANALMALSQGFTVSGTSGQSGGSDGSQAIDTPGVSGEMSSTPPAIPSVIDVTPNN